MTLDKSYIDRNRASTERIRALVARLSDDQMQTPVGEHWTVAYPLRFTAGTLRGRPWPTSHFGTAA